MFTRNFEPDLVQESIEGDVYKVMPLFSIPLVIQARRLVELGSAFSRYPFGYKGSVWDRSWREVEGVIATRIMLTACRMLRDFSGIEATLTSVDIRDGWATDDNGAPINVQQCAEDLIARLGLRDLWYPVIGTDSLEWLASERPRIEAHEAEPIDFLLVDSNHTYEQVKGELDGALPLMAERGVILVDDCYSTNYRHGATWTPEESELGIRRGGEYGAILEFLDAHPDWQAEWLQYMCLLRRR
jgi:hypothetical protein